MPGLTFDRCEQCQRISTLSEGRCQRCLGAEEAMRFSASYTIPPAAVVRGESLSAGLGSYLSIEVGAGRVIFFFRETADMRRLAASLTALADQADAGAFGEMEHPLPFPAEQGVG